jgi:hypothetical protein
MVAPTSGDGAGRNEALAGAWMQLGFAAVNRGDPFALEQALHCFDQAIAVREPLLDAADPWTAYNLAGAWLNRGEALDRMGGETHLDAAIASYDCAIALMSALPPATEGRWRERWAVGQLNRGTTLLNRGHATDAKASLRAFAAVLAILDAGRASLPLESMSGEAAELIVASAQAHQADALARLESWEAARAAALAAMGAVAARESIDRAAARIGLKARLALCACSAGELSRVTGRMGPPPSGRLTEALDAAEAGIALARHWPDDTRLEPLRRELVRFSAQGYARRQPHLLNEFIGENLAVADPIAASARATAIRGLVNAGIKSVAHPDLGTTLATLRELSEAPTNVPA